MENLNIIVRVAGAADQHYAEAITAQMAESAKARGTGIAKRSQEYIRTKMTEGKAIIAVTNDGTWVGFCYIEAWQHEKYVANSGLIVSPTFRGLGVAKEIKRKVFELSRKKYPDAQIFGLTTGLAVMKINTSLGYKPVTYSELTTDEEFWKGCQSCVNFDILTMKERKNCLCTAMLYTPSAEAEFKTASIPNLSSATVTHNVNLRKRLKSGRTSDIKLLKRWVRYKGYVILKGRGKKSVSNSMKSDRKFKLFGFFL